MFRRFLGLDNWTKSVVAALLGGTLAAISYGLFFSHTLLNAASFHHPGVDSVAAGRALLLTAVADSADTTDDTPATAQKPLTGCGGPTISLDSGMSPATMRSKISHAPRCALIVFAAGTYNIAAPIDIPCGVTITGPATSPATAILAAAYTGNVIFSVGNCSAPVTIGYLHFENTGGIYVNAPMSGITVTHSQFTNLPATHQQWADMGIYFDGTKGGTIRNATITNNTFGDPSSCSAVMSIDHDEGGLCNGIFFQGNLDGIVIENNTFTHLEEGFHVLCFPGDKCTGSWRADLEPLHRAVERLQSHSPHRGGDAAAAGYRCRHRLQLL